MQDEAAREADRYARREEWGDASVYCAQAIAAAEHLREQEPDELAHLTTLADLQYFYAEILKHLDQLPEAVDAARIGRDLYHALLGINPVHVADRARDADSRLGLLELMARDSQVPYDDRVPVARALASDKPGPENDLDLARQIVRQTLDHTASIDDLWLLLEAVSTYRRLRPLGEDDLELFARAARHTADALMARQAYPDAAECAADAAQAFSALAVRRPERYERPWYEARELAAQARAMADETDG